MFEQVSNFWIGRHRHEARSDNEAYGGCSFTEPSHSRQPMPSPAQAKRGGNRDNRDQQPSMGKGHAGNNPG